MFDNSLVRFIVFLIVVVALNYIVRRFLDGWAATPVAAKAKKKAFTPPEPRSMPEAPEVPEVPQRATERPIRTEKRRPSREISKIQTSLEAPRPDQDMADPYMARKKAMQKKHAQLAQRRNASQQQTKVRKHKRPHRSATHSSESGRRIQL